MDSWGTGDEIMWELGSSFVGALACFECAIRAMTGWRADGGLSWEEARARSTDQDGELGW